VVVVVGFVVDGLYIVVDLSWVRWFDFVVFVVRLQNEVKRTSNLAVLFG